ncbi:tRNA (guanosine(37)-N1)-methyltransferase TrmD [Pseudenhygromyxa sp. WMMC2535]|nr:tRNA (guanosine(37)-N1)-methyltransferase TrmD [Pseudenhygromyxa sp. WMMC2535]
MAFEVFTLFPEIVEAFVNAGLMGKAVTRGLVQVHCTNFRDFTHDRHRTVDDAPFGGGAGMVIKPEPVVDALEAVTAARGPMHRILLTPSGATFDQRAAERLARMPRLALLCGRYEGIDDRVREGWVDECLSIGDFVLNGGEVAAAVIIEAVGRLREGVLGNPDSIVEESHHDEGDWGTVLEHPHYTRPAEFRGREIPPVLLAGDHGKVEAWRRRQACLRTWALRPELRPRWRLPAEHPCTLVAPADTPEGDLEVLRELAAAAGWGIRVIGSNMRDLKQLRRALRRRHGAEPWFVGVGPWRPADPLPPRGPRLVLDTLAFERRAFPGPLALWLGEPQDPAAAGLISAWLALDTGEGAHEDVRSNHRRRLAIASALIDISQPPAARASAVSLAQLVLAAMRAEGLLPASA